MKKLLQYLLKKIRMFFIFEKHFIGKYVDIDIERRRWAKDNDVIIVAEKTVRNFGARKVLHQIVFFAHDNNLTKILGFRKKELHYILSSWY